VTRVERHGAARAASRRRETGSFAVLLLVGLTVAIAASVLPPSLARAEIATQVQIETDLTCQCGCGLTVHSCNHLNCGSGIPLKNEIAEQIATGASREDILAYFQAKYGEKILSSPTTTGFNIAAWTVPFVVIAIGGLVIGVVLARWKRAAPETGPAAAPSGVAASSEMRARLERELEDYERR
jgi:cytochrome c-type biogenesis protein CcmH/NrfF